MRASSRLPLTIYPQGVYFTGMEHDCCRKKERSGKEFNDLMNRLRRIEGQVRGIETMLENSAYCPDILVQVAAVNSALKSFSRILLSEHLKTCVRSDILAGREDTMEELAQTLQKVMK